MIKVRIVSTASDGAYYEGYEDQKECDCDQGTELLATDGERCADDVTKAV